MRLFIAIAAILLAAPPAAARSPAQETPASLGAVAAGALYDFCLPLFGPGPVLPDRISATASMAGLTAAPRGAQAFGFQRVQAAFLAPAPFGSQVRVFWVADPAACQIVIVGPPGAGSDLLGALTQIGWTPAEQGVATSPDTVADVWVGQPRGYTEQLVIVANRWVTDAAPESSVRVVLNLMRAD